MPSKKKQLKKGKKIAATKPLKLPDSYRSIPS